MSPLRMEHWSWRVCSLRLITKITTEKEFVAACSIGDVLSISRCVIDSHWVYQYFGIPCAKGYLELVKLLINKGVNKWDYALYCACNEGHMEIAKLLITKGTKSSVYYELDEDDNLWLDKALDEDDNLDFHYAMKGACLGGHLELAQLMIDHGANDWNSALYHSCEGGSHKVVDLLIRKGADNWNNGLWGACAGGHKELVEAMIARGANCFDHPFITACAGGHLEVAQFMFTKWSESSRISGTFNDVNQANLLNNAIYQACNLINRVLCNSYERDKELMFNETVKGPPNGFVLKYLRIIRWLIENGCTKCGCRQSIEEHQALYNRYLSAIK